MFASRGILIALGGVLMAGALGSVSAAQRYGQGPVPYYDPRYFGPKVLPNDVPTYRAGVGVVHVPIPMVGKTQLAESQLKWNWGAVSEDSPLKLRLPAAAPIMGANSALALADGPSQAYSRLGSGGQKFSGSGFTSQSSAGGPKLSLPLDRTGKSLSQMPTQVPGGTPRVDLGRNWGRKLTSARTNWRETNVAAAKSVEEALKQVTPPQNFAAPNAGPSGDWWNGTSPAALIGSPIEGATMIWDANRPWGVVPAWHEWTESTEAWQGAP